MQISVVIPTYNRARIIGNAIGSVLAQTRSAAEIIVVDDGSTDDTRERIAHYGSAIRYLHQENSGASAARNRGIMESRGNWIAFLDSDDEWEPEKLSRQAAAIQRDASIVLAVTNGHTISKDDQQQVNFFGTRSRTAALGEAMRVENPLLWALDTTAMTPAVVVARDALLRVGLFDTNLRMFEDLDLLCRLSKQGAWWFDPTPLFRVYRRGEVGTSLSEQSAAQAGHGITSLIRVYEKLLERGDLTVEERHVVRRRLSSQRADLASLRREREGFWKALPVFGRSIADYPSIISTARAAAGAAAGVQGLSWLRSLKKNEGESLPGVIR